MTLSDSIKTLILWIVIATVLLAVFNSFSGRTSNSRELVYSDFIEMVRAGLGYLTVRAI